MLTVTAGDVMSTLRGGDGQPLVRVGDALLRAELARSAVAQANIETDHKSHADGGVDTTVAVALAHDRLGYFGAPSCWQYKGTSQQGFGDSKVRAELKKDRCISLIKKGYAWRLVIADEIPAGKRANLLKTARDAVRQLNPTAPDPIIVTASDMSNWISQYPSLVLRFFAVPNAELLHIDAWNDSIIRDTPQYQEIPSWAAVRSAIERHCDFSANPVSSVLAIQGQAGVGKTRLVFETLHRHEGTRQLVVYTAHSGAAEKIAYYLARENETRCVLVVDECSPTLRLHLEQVLNGTRCRTRVRVVALDNSGVRASRSAVEAQQPSMNATELGLVLGANFPQVPSDRRRTYAELAEGFIRLAADLCVSDPLASTQSLQIPGGLHQYVTSRLGSRQPALEALGLVWRIGFRDDVADEFQALCSWLSLDPQLTRSQLREMKERPGFAKDAGR